MRISHLRTALVAVCIAAALALQGCVLAAAGAGAAGGYAASQNGYGVQSPVKKDSSGGYKVQNPITHDDCKDDSDTKNTQCNK